LWIWIVRRLGGLRGGKWMWEFVLGMKRRGWGDGEMHAYREAKLLEGQLDLPHHMVLT
jgi:hypothetical protein